jgi:MEMO1 family protein
MRRLPAVAGKFYGGHPAQLAEEVAQCSFQAPGRAKVIGAVSPHAGLMYSGRVAGSIYSSIVMPKTFIIIGPNHTGLGPDMSVMSSGEWLIPTAVFKIDEELGKSMLENMPMLTEDIEAQTQEHSVEMQLPFIAYAAGQLGIVPVVAGDMTLEECAAAGKGMAAAIKKTGRDVVIIASSDMSHYVRDDIARETDGLAIKKILDLDPDGLYSTVVGNRISMCGLIPVTIMLYAALELGATESALLRYATSGETSNDYDSVVGYAGLIVR